ncbi:MAG: glycosyltransferase [Ilumatobacteraceae bacterium]
MTLDHVDAPAPWRLSVVLASYNEARSIGPVLAEIREAAETLKLSNVTLNVILVDDSSDATAAIAERAARTLGLDFEVVPGQASGLGGAMLAGMRHSLGHNPDSIVTLDADGQHNPLLIPTLHRAFAARDADLLIGSRWARGGTSPGTGVTRTVGSRTGNRVFRAITGTRNVRDATTSFRIYSPRLVRYLLASPSSRYEGYSFFSTTVGLAEAAGFVISEVPITFRPRYSGTSKFNRSEAVRFFATLPTLRRERREAMNVSADIEYLASDELDLLSAAHRWNRFLLDASLQAMVDDRVDRVLEVGAGRGAILDALEDRFPDASITGLEPDDANFEVAAARFTSSERVSVRNETLEEHLATSEGAGRYDLIVFINVLEHIEDDLADLRLARSALRPGGHVAILVPALPGLYGPIDFKSGHFRRYDLDTLTSVIQDARLTLMRARHIDPIGILPYWVNYRLLNKSGISSGGVWTFENIFVPVTVFAQRLAPRLPIGKNLVALARRPLTDA